MVSIVVLVAQAVLAQIVLVAFLIMVTYSRPYRRTIDNHLQIVSLVGEALAFRNQIRNQIQTPCTIQATAHGTPEIGKCHF